jgi:hypothetical protein
LASLKGLRQTGCGRPDEIKRTILSHEYLTTSRDHRSRTRADRIDHGVRAIEDRALVSMLVDRQIPLGICPTSNLVLGVYGDKFDPAKLKALPAGSFYIEPANVNHF